MHRLQEMGIPTELILGIMALYKSVIGHVGTSKGLSTLIHSTIGVKQGCPLSPTLFGMYVDEVSDYIDRDGDRGAQLAGTWIPLLLYADDIVLISDSPKGMQQHLDALHSFAKDSGLSVNLGKTKVMVFNTTPQWVRRSVPTFNMVRRLWSIQMHRLTWG
ncbi:reverse transcriptase domain-containing protein [Enterobacter cloacae complex sp. GF14B]|uniref:reverse transcriptase domain-containing protein n=1 Tax=Enterobacter cloacae complex sp. GF14B TaxID=2511982 RepID=UPI00159EDBBF|nr:reverse transcriptase domain-containing protein [Enterobacter cloacae complex sp. GF14B]